MGNRRIDGVFMFKCMFANDVGIMAINPRDVQRNLEI